MLSNLNFLNKSLIVINIESQLKCCVLSEKINILFSQHSPVSLFKNYQNISSHPTMKSLWFREMITRKLAEM